MTGLGGTGILSICESNSRDSEGSAEGPWWAKVG
jgi:hypothetical protein